VGKFSRLLVVYGCVVLLLSSCSSQSGGGGSEEDLQAQAPVEPLSCIAVLPAGTLADKDETMDYPEAQSLEKGAVFATEVISRELRGNPKVRILSASQVAALAPDISGGIAGTIAELGQKLDCDGVLQTTVRRFQQREGTEYAVDSPAAVDLSLVLRHSGDGNILWSAEIREQQQSLLSNIFSFGKARKRGFKWVTVEQLMEQGIKERLDDCPYLQ
jgi:hypothetical protein